MFGRHGLIPFVAAGFSTFGNLPGTFHRGIGTVLTHTLYKIFLVLHPSTSAPNKRAARFLDFCFLTNQ